MKKNNKGFTLVELLAALVILGVLSALALPTVVNLLGNSREKLYVTDAKKLISQAEYKFRVASSEIEKPDDGECLILSMVYLDNSDFDNPPNNGEYVREASYVVVKNNGGTYEFSVELVEELKGNVYKGVELSKDSTLTTSSTRHVVNFDKDELNFVENNTVMGKYGGNQVDTSYINSKLGSSYVSGITKVYNYPDLADNTYNANYSIPKIARAEYVSASNKNFNSLDTIVKVVATDKDTPTDKLTVYVGPGKGGKYPSLTAPDCDASQPYNFTECKYSYGSLSDFSLKVDFSQDGYDYSGQTTSLYILVVDPEGNTDRINPEYKIHTNEAPVIDKNKSGIFKRSTDSVNLSTAVLRLYVSDDSTANSDLEYCITENKDATSCVGYQKYSNFVNSEITHTFSCGNECSYDGRTMYLKVFLRDTDPTKVLETTATFSYNLFQNDVPQIVLFDLISEKLSFVNDNAKALKADVKLEINDSSSSGNITVVLDESANFDKNPVTYKYSDFSGNVSYTFSGLYDGAERVLYVKVIDEYNSEAKTYKNYGTVHKNAKPVIEEIKVTSESLLEKVCPNSKICDKYDARGGAYEVTVDVTASDELVSEDDLLICISTNQSDCTDINSNNFVQYNSGRSQSLAFTPSSTTEPYDGTIKKVYVSVYDGYGVAVDNSYNYSEYSTLTTADYQVYKNHEPEINEDEVTIVSKNIDYNFKDVTVSFKVNDDLDSINRLTYKLYDNAGGTPVEGTITSTSADVANEIDYTFGGNYDGGERMLTIEVTDTYGATTSFDMSYEIHTNEAPRVNYVTVDSAGDPCETEACTNGNGVNTTVKFSITDDLDSSLQDIQLCVSETEGDCTEYKAIKDYTGFKEENGEFYISHVITSDALPYRGQEEYVYLYFKDSYGAISKGTGNYLLYNNNKAVVDNEYPKVLSSNYEEMEVEVSEGEVYTTNKNPNLSTINFSLKATDEFIESKNLKYQVCYTTNLETKIDGTEGVTCLENNKFYDYGDAEISTQSLDLGITSYEGQEFFIFAKVYDDYALSCYNDSSTCGTNDNYISYSSTAYYQVYEDLDPEITKFTVSRQADSLSYDTLDVVLNVNDTFDTYTYCISESETECTNYSTTSYSGDSGEDVTTTYSPSWGSTYDPSVERTYLVYLHVKDSHDKTAVFSTFPDRVPCDAVIDDEGNVTDSGTIQDSIVYELNSGSEELTATKCSNKCYYWESDVINGETVGPSDTANIVAYYKRTITFLDKDDNSIVCNKDIIEDYEVHCNFRTCYYNSSSNNYQVTAIGYVTHENTDSSFTHTVDGETHIPSYYRYEYTTDYDEQTDLILLHSTGNKICGQCFDEGKYDNVIITYDNNEEAEG